MLNYSEIQYYYKYGSNNNIAVRIKQIGKYYNKTGLIYCRYGLSDLHIILIDDSGLYKYPKFREKDFEYL